MDSIGEKLRQERVRRGLDIEGIAERTKINPSLLLAIENNDLSKLPGTFFTRSFVRQYARALGLDEKEFESELGHVASEPAAPEGPAAEQTAGPIRRDRIRLEPLKPSRGMRGGFVGQLVAFILVLAICSGVYSFWQKSRSAQSRTEPAQTQAQQKPKPATPAPPPPPAATLPATDQSAAAATPAGMSAAPGQVVLTPASTAVPATTTAAQTPQPAAPATAAAPAEGTPASSAPVRVEFRATEPAWVRVTADGKVLFMGTIEAGQSKTFDATAALRIRTGNAGGVEATWNGKATGPLGPAGQVRDVEFTPSAFRIVPPAPKPPAESKPPEEIKQFDDGFLTS